MSIIGNYYGFLGHFNHSTDKSEKAEELYEKGLQRGMKKPKYLLSYGVLMLKEGKFEKAKDLFSEVLISISAKDEFKTIAKINISLAYWKLGEIDVAIEMLEEVHRKHRSGKVYGTLGYLLTQKGDLEESLQYNLEAVDYDDEDPVVLDNLAQTYYKMGRIEEAKEYFEKAEEHKDDQAVTLYHLGIIYADEGDIELAKEKLNKAMTCNLTPLSAVTYKDIEEKLEALENRE